MSVDFSAVRPVHRGLHFEDYAPGQVIVSGARTVTEADIAAFASLSGDFNPLHVDETFARRTPFRGRIAHGMLVNAIASGLAAQIGIFDGTIAAFAALESHFRQPVRAGDTVFIRLEVASVDSEPSRRRGRVEFDTAMINQEGQVTADGRWSMLILRKRPEAS